MNKTISVVTIALWLNNKQFTHYFLTDIDKLLKPYGLDINTYDIQPVSSADFVFYIPWWERFDILPSSSEVSKSFLFMWEPEINSEYCYHKMIPAYFNKIFTFNDDLVDNKKYFKINWFYNVPKVINKSIYRPNFCTLISSNKFARKFKISLYGERIKTIRWFERYHLDKFDLYGRNWNKYIERNWFIRQLTKIHPLSKWFLRKVFFKTYPSYKGTIDESYASKIAVLQKYKFAICYENAIESGYISEKIFDCFAAGCVPIYWGAPNIDKYIPAGCFIDRRKFKDHEQVYSYISSISDAEYAVYLNNIEEFLNSPKAYPFSMQCFIDTILKEIVHAQ